jgi:hypothetical protein
MSCPGIIKSPSAPILTSERRVQEPEPISHKVNETCKLLLEIASRELKVGPSEAKKVVYPALFFEKIENPPIVEKTAPVVTKMIRSPVRYVADSTSPKTCSAFEGIAKLPPHQYSLSDNWIRYIDAPFNWN